MDSGMTKGEREEIRLALRSWARVRKAEVDEAKASRLADFEAQMSTIYKPDDDPAWKAASDEIEALGREADRQIAEIYRGKGLIERFRPGIHVLWYGRGENASAARRAELRKVALTSLDAEVKRAKRVIETRVAEVQMRLVSGALQTAEAREFLGSLPGPGALMPELSFGAIEALVGRNHSDSFNP